MSDGAGALAGQTVVVIGGSGGIGLETARLARAQGADVVLTGRNPERLEKAASEVGAERTAAFDAADEAALEAFFADLATPIDHVLSTAGLSDDGPLPELDFAAARRSLDDHFWLAIHVAQLSIGKVRPGGSLLFMSGTGGRSRGVGLSIIAAFTAAMPALVENLAVEVAPIRINLIAPGFVDTGLSADLLGDQLEARR